MELTGDSTQFNQNGTYNDVGGDQFNINIVHIDLSGPQRNDGDFCLVSSFSPCGQSQDSGPLRIVTVRSLAHLITLPIAICRTVSGSGFSLN